MGYEGPVLRPRCIGTGRAQTQTPLIRSFIQGQEYIGLYEVILENKNTQ